VKVSVWVPVSVSVIVAVRLVITAGVLDFQMRFAPFDPDD